VKAVFVGGGSLRVLGIVRGALGEPGIFEGGEISLFDLNAERAEAMGRMILKTPEYARVGCKVSCAESLAEALEGADMVGVILMAGSEKTFRLGEEACYRHRFIPSDNLSPNGAFLAIKGAPILLNIAQQMTRYCPSAWLVDFANPIAVLSGMINNHTTTKSLGVCAGYTNHQWDLSRILGKDEEGTGFDVDTVGVNHLSFIVKGTVNGKDLFKTLDERLADGWKMPRLQSTWSQAFRRSIPRGIRTIIQFFRELGVLIFSSEGDGMMHLHYDEVLKDSLSDFKPSTPIQLRAKLQASLKARRRADREFRSYLTRELNTQFWDKGWRQPGLEWAKRQDRDIFVEILRGISGVKSVKIVASRPNRGAVNGLSDRTVLEYSQLIDNGKIRAAGNYQVPAAVRNITYGLASHQTKLGDALAMQDPRLLAEALLSYPVRPFTLAARSLCKDLAKINRDEMPATLRRVGDYL
jgi:alpha-galactosidase/6-phospho-beta-glucosidase family protein